MKKKLKSNKNIIFQKIDNKLIGFDIEHSSLYTLNETAEYIFKKTRAGVPARKIAESLSAKFDVDIKTALQDVLSTVELLKKNKMI